jgi:phosphoglycerate dehydrogenase-like enzyme
MRVAILDDYQAVALGFADWSGLEVTVFTDHVASDDALVERLAPYEAVVAMRERTPFTAARLARLPRLRLLVTTGMYNAAIDLDAAREHDVTVCGTGSLASPTAELTWGLILAVARRIPAEDAAVRAGGWQHTVGPELAGRTLGVIGHGRLGSRVAAIGRAFEMEILAWSQNLREAEGATVVSKEELLERSDVISIHLKLSERSRGLIGAAELARMKPTALLINTSRGPIVDEPALLQALRAGTIGGAGLDVYDTEPLPAGHPLRSAPNTVLTPHIGYVSTGTYERFYADAAEDVRAFAAGAPVRILTTRPASPAGRARR